MLCYAEFKGKDVSDYEVQNMEMVEQTILYLIMSAL